ncbi:MAG TPA: Gfo/Idh/MocA family oxidoreductase, partial [Candidatus Limnocylindria bacterium]|nr:Gfo/Idh/MocA family oxidoreductase [Candidatus Limnocylindria bacterium]
MDVLRWGILSTADIARRKVVPGMRGARRCEIVAIASRDGARADAVAAELGIPRAHASYEGLLADPEVDAVYIPLPNHLHAEWAIAAARAGKHVLCEKPMALTADDAQRMVDVAREEGVLLMEAFMYRLHPSWEAVLEMVRGGEIGRLVSVQSWFSYFNDDATNIRNIRDVGGGALFDIGCYSVSLSRVLFGAEPTRVSAALLRDPELGVDVLTSAILTFDDGLASFTCSTRAEDDQRVHIYGTEGRISIGIPFNIPPDRATEVWVTHGGDPPVAPDTRVLTFETADPYTVETERFAAAVLDGTQPPVPPEDAVRNLRVMERIFAAAEAPDREPDAPEAAR